MQLQQRRTFFLVFAIFFVICLPFLILFSLGYSVNLKNPEIRNSLSVKLQTIPSGAEVSANEDKKGVTPIDLAINENQNINLKIKLKEYFAEEFVVSSGINNSIVDLSNLWLLPTKSEKISEVKYDIVQIISENLALLKSNDRFWIQSFSLAGFDNDPQLIQLQNKISNKDLSFPKLEEEYQIKLNENQTPWQKISNSAFYRDNILLWKRENYWQLIDLKKNDINVKKILKVDDNHLAILENEKKLWLFEPDLMDLKFIDQGIEAMNSIGTPSKVWLWRYNTLFRFNSTDILSGNLDWNRNSFLKNGLIADEIGGIFDVQNVFQGVAVQVGKYIFYVPDSKENQWQLLTTNTKKFATENETLFWIDDTNNLTSINLYNGYKRYITLLPSAPTSFGFVKEWNRLMFYSPNSVSSIWYNKDILNTDIKIYNNSTWINNQQCFNKIINKVQYCIDNKSLVVYKNNNLF
jgi:hypothetical protein